MMKGFSLRKPTFSLSRVASLLIYKNSVRWWPGDRSATKDWTRWDEGGFNSGVAGPFLTYAAENSQSLYLRHVQATDASFLRPFTAKSRETAVYVSHPDAAGPDPE